MPRKNPLASKNAQQKISNPLNVSDESPVHHQDSLDGLPVVESSNSNTELSFLNNKGETETICLDFATKLEPNSIPVKNKRGKSYLTWFYDLYQKSPNDALTLTRIYIHLRKNEGSPEHKKRAFQWLAKYLIDSGKPLTSIEYKSLESIYEANCEIERTTLKTTFNILINVLCLVPNLKDKVKVSIRHYEPPNALQSKNRLKTAEERIKKSRINNDYSEYVMFQIYAYTNACLMEIKEANTRLEVLLDSGKQKRLFTPEGLRLFRKLINSGDITQYEEALDMELIAYRHCTNALKQVLDSQMNEEHVGKVLKHIENFEFDKGFNLLPVQLRRSSDVKYLFEGILKNGVADNKKSLRPFLRAFTKVNYLDIQTILTPRIHQHDKWRCYREYLSSSYVTYELFYGPRKEKEFIFAAHADPFHHVLLGESDKFDFLVIILLLCESGRNLEVATNLPYAVNHIDNQTPIIDVSAPFASEPSCWLTSFKTRGHVTGKGAQEEDIVVPYASALFQYLSLLDKIRSSLLTNREFFFSISKTKMNSYLRAFATFAGIKDKNGEKLKRLQTRRFRKVWSGEVLLQYLEDVDTKDDLIKAVAEDLRNSIPLTYLLQSSRTESMLASAIIGLQMRFISEHQKLAAQLKLDGEIPDERNREKRFLCDCLDPSKPDYTPNLEVAYCRQYDSCLGCSRAAVFDEHIPNIIYRCFQYEQLLRESRDLYMAHYETKHEIAIEALERYKSKAENGQQKHADAFKIALSDWEDERVQRLPPLIHSRINNLNVIQTTRVR